MSCLVRRRCETTCYLRPANKSNALQDWITTLGLLVQVHIVLKQLWTALCIAVDHRSGLMRWSWSEDFGTVHGNPENVRVHSECVLRLYSFVLVRMCLILYSETPTHMPEWGRPSERVLWLVLWCCSLIDSQVVNRGDWALAIDAGGGK